MRDIHAISSEICATELMALLLECSEIKKLWPQYNRTLKQFEPKFGLYHYEARNGYQYLAVNKLAKFQSPIETFNDIYHGINVVRQLAEQFEIDHRFCIFGPTNNGETIAIQQSNDLPKTEDHNSQIEKALEHLSNNRPTFAIIEKGRDKNEQSCIWVENGHFYGMGYIPTDTSFQNPAEIREFLTRYPSNHYIIQLLYKYVENHPAKVKNIHKSIEFG